MTSTVVCETSDGVTLSDLFAALFPSGSVTGAPKLAASAAIANLESEPRGVYCGSVGIVEPGGDCIFNVAIRTLVVDSSGAAVYGAGGGITADSVADSELDELMSKAAVLAAAPEDFDLFETIRLDGGRLHRIDRHMERLVQSARYFGFADPESSVALVRRDLELRAAESRAGLFRIRATLRRSGERLVEIRTLDDSPEPRRMVLVATPVDSTDRMLYHKTTRRWIYERQTIDLQAADDVVLFNERGEITESTIGNLVLELDGRLVTPAQSCGLLAGILRQELLEAGTITECVIPVSALATCSRLWMINSLRGWVAAELVRTRGELGQEIRPGSDYPTPALRRVSGRAAD
jgi:para-aminobenzoate synthetase/4-amino-4-deoxychorismate lyase